MRIFDPDETESERTVIISEREGSENSYFWLLNEEVQAAAFQVHSYRHPSSAGRRICVTMPAGRSLTTITGPIYTASNAVAVAVGDFDIHAMLRQALQPYFGALPAGPTIPPVQMHEPRNGRTTGSAARRDPTAYLIMAFHAPAAPTPGLLPADRPGCSFGRRQGTWVSSAAAPTTAATASTRRW